MYVNVSEYVLYEVVRAFENCEGYFVVLPSGVFFVIEKFINTKMTK